MNYTKQQRTTYNMYNQKKQLKNQNHDHISEVFQTSSSQTWQSFVIKFILKHYNIK